MHCIYYLNVAILTGVPTTKIKMLVTEIRQAAVIVATLREFFMIIQKSNVKNHE